VRFHFLKALCSLSLGVFHPDSGSQYLDAFALSLMLPAFVIPILISRRVSSNTGARPLATRIPLWNSES
ncbi:MAG: hypothetical protein V7K50_11650, partial [Nostoc sp.]